MFTGIIEEQGRVLAMSAPTADTGAVLQISCRTVADSVPHGASINVNGVCLTVVDADRAAAGVAGRRLDFDVMGETLDRTGIGSLRPGALVNLERAVRADGRLDGHIVQGHVDGVSRVLTRTPGPAWESVRFALGSELARYVAEKGSITVNGVSLTVSAVSPVGDPDGWFEVGLIPETLRATNLGSAPPGTVVNLEVDVLAKYTERLLQRAPVPAVVP